MDRCWFVGDRGIGESTKIEIASGRRSGPSLDAVLRVTLPLVRWPGHVFDRLGRGGK